MDDATRPKANKFSLDLQDLLVRHQILHAARNCSPFYIWCFCKTAEVDIRCEKCALDRPEFDRTHIFLLRCVGCVCVLAQPPTKLA